MNYFPADLVGESSGIDHLKTAEILLSNMKDILENGQDRNFVEGLLSATAYVIHRLTSVEPHLITQQQLSTMKSSSEDYANAIAESGNFWLAGTTEQVHQRLGIAKDKILQAVVDIPRSPEPQSEALLNYAQALMGRYEGALDSSQEALEEATRKLSEIEETRGRALDILVEISASAMGGNYAKHGYSLSEIARKWHWAGLFVLVCLVGLATGAFFGWYGPLANHETSIPVALAAGYSLNASILLFAFVLLGRSRHYQRRGEELSRVADELILFWDVVERLPEDQRRQMVEAVIPRYFGGGTSPRSTAPGFWDKVTSFSHPPTPNQ